MTRRCSQCSNNGHNTRTCPGRERGVKLFGVRLTDGSMIKKSASMGNLILSSSPPPPPNPCSLGYLSDHLSPSLSLRTKGVPWTEEEHRLFLIGLQKLGKGDWRGIARNFVLSRTPTQVASHAQKYFIRLSHASRRKRRSSLFDMLPHMSSDPPSLPDEQLLLPPSENSQPCNGKSQPSLNLSLISEFEPMETTCQENVQQTNGTMIRSNVLTPMATQGFFPSYLPVPYTFWPSTAAPPIEQVKGGDTSHHQVHKPIPVIPNEPVNVDQLVGMSHLRIGETQGRDRQPSPLSLNLLGEPSRQSAFHTNAPVASSELKTRKNNAIQAVSVELLRSAEDSTNAGEASKNMHH